MPKRPDPAALIEREETAVRGREAVYEPPASSVVGRAPANGASGWEGRHKRVTFHCPLELLEAIEAEMTRSGRSKNSVIVEAIRADLGKR